MATSSTTTRTGGRCRGGKRRIDGSQSRFKTVRTRGKNSSSRWIRRRIWRRRKPDRVATTFRNAQTVQSINAALAQNLYAKRAGADGKNIPQLLAGTARYCGGARTPTVEQVGLIEREGYTIVKLAMRP